MRATTRRSLLLRLKDRDDHDAWKLFYELYAPLLQRYARAHGLSAADADEARDHCLEVAARRLPEFDYDPRRGRFKAWLFRIAHARVVDLLRRAETRAAAPLPASLASGSAAPEELWERQWREQHLRFAFEQARAGVSSRDFRAVEMLLVEDAAVAQVCAALGMSANQVYKAKARVLRRARAVLERLEG